MIPLLERRPALWITVGVTSPLLLAAVVLYWRDWVPLLDMVMTELRVRDVGGSHTPLVGLPGRIGDFPDQGSHPGPWSFYLVAPFYRLAGSTPWGMQLASVVINSSCVAAIVYLGRRRYGFVGAVVFAALAAVAIRGYGLNVLTQPWNPYFGVLLWMVALIAAWYVLAGDFWMAIVVVVATNLAAQTHVPYLPSAVALNALVLAWLIREVLSARRQHGDGPTRQLCTMVAIGGAFWIPPVIDQLRNDPGNIRRLIRHFATDQPEESIGLWSALKLVSQHFDVLATLRGLLTDEQATIQRASQVGSFSVVGLVVLTAWAAAAVWAIGRRHSDLVALHAVTATAVLAGWISISRIFGRVWFYLTIWMSSAMLLAVVGIAWTLWIIARQRRLEQGSAPSPRRLITLTATAVGTVMTLLSLGAAAGHQEPEHAAAAGVRAVVPRVVDALEANIGTASGRQGTYVVFWQESAIPAAQGFGLLGELERRNYQVGVDATWRVPATEQRVLEPGEWNSEIHLVSGSYIDVWRTRTAEGYTEVASYDGRTVDEQQRFAQLAAGVDERLAQIDRSDLIPIVDLNILRVTLEPGLPADIIDDLSEMLDIGVPLAVFIAPPGAFLAGIGRITADDD